jgi:hypothetical protein
MNFFIYYFSQWYLSLVFSRSRSYIISYLLESLLCWNKSRLLVLAFKFWNKILIYVISAWTHIFIFFHLRFCESLNSRAKELQSFRFRLHFKASLNLWIVIRAWSWIVIIFIFKNINKFFFWIKEILLCRWTIDILIWYFYELACRFVRLLIQFQSNIRSSSGCS